MIKRLRQWLARLLWEPEVASVCLHFELPSPGMHAPTEWSLRPEDLPNPATVMGLTNHPGWQAVEPFVETVLKNLEYACIKEPEDHRYHQGRYEGFVMYRGVIMDLAEEQAPAEAKTELSAEERWHEHQKKYY